MSCPRCSELWSKTGLPRADWVALETDEGEPYYAHYHLAVSQWNEPTQWQHTKLQEGKLAAKQEKIDSLQCRPNSGRINYTAHWLRLIKSPP